MKLIAFDVKKAQAGVPVVTRGGLPVRLFCYDLKGHHAGILGAVLETEGKEIVTYWGQNGLFRASGQHHYDLMHPVQTVWVNIYPGTSIANLHDTREEADRKAARERVACIEIEKTWP